MKGMAKSADHGRGWPRLGYDCLCSLDLMVENLGVMMLYRWKWNVIVAFLHWFAPGLGRSEIIYIALIKEEHPVTVAASWCSDTRGRHKYLLFSWHQFLYTSVSDWWRQLLPRNYVLSERFLYGNQWANSLRADGSRTIRLHVVNQKSFSYLWHLVFRSEGREVMSFDIGKFCILHHR